jgi:c-di-GMP-binding flagellar brake protein YcgR
MTSVSTANNNDTEQIIADLCARNLVGELVYSPEPGLNRRGKVRFLGCSSDGLFIDYPLIDGKPVSFVKGEAVTIYFCLDEMRMAIDSRVVRQTRYIQNQTSEIRALLLRMPAEIKKSQRRSCFRLHAIHLDMDELYLYPKTNHTSHKKAVPGRIKNLSETGCGLLVHRRDAKNMVTGQVYQVSLQLEESEDPVLLTCELRWLETHSSNEWITAGFSWQFDHADLKSRELQHRLAKFIMAKQLEFARRRREKD